MSEPNPNLLFTRDQLVDWLQRPVSAEAAAAAEQVVWGWLRPVIKIDGATPDDRPWPVSPELFSWAIELGAIAVSNPEGLSEYALGPERSKYSAETRTRILAAAASGGTTTDPDAPARPVGSFPPSRPWPDPVERW